jgi:hypothetical protein
VVGDVVGDFFLDFALLAGAGVGDGCKVGILLCESQFGGFMKVVAGDLER